MFALKFGNFGRTEKPAIEDKSQPGGCVDLRWWIDFTKRSPRLEQVLYPDDRPSALFTRSDDSRFEVRYQFGVIVPQEWEWKDATPMQELLAHMNEARTAT